MFHIYILHLFLLLHSLLFEVFVIKEKNKLIEQQEKLISTANENLTAAINKDLKEIENKLSVIEELEKRSLWSKNLSEEVFIKQDILFPHEWII